MSAGQSVDWDAKTVIGSKSRAPKVARNTSELNGASAMHFVATVRLFNMAFALQPHDVQVPL
jgi:hypothetical protein